MSSCICYEPICETITGGLVLSGDIIATTSRMQGGLILSGSIRPDITGRVADGLAALWPLEEDGEPYTDLVDSLLAEANFEPTQSAGVNCSYSQLFDGTDDQVFLADTGTHTQWTVSFWAKISTNFRERVFYKRGDLEISHSYLNHLLVVYDPEEEAVYSTTLCKPNRWYFFACTYDGITLKLYINGIEEESVDVEITAPTGTANLSPPGFFSGYLQELRVYSEALPENELLMLWQNYCKRDFYTVSQVVSRYGF